MLPIFYFGAFYVVENKVFYLYSKCGGVKVLHPHQKSYSGKVQILQSST